MAVPHDAWGRPVGPRSNTITLRDSHPAPLHRKRQAHYGIYPADLISAAKAGTLKPNDDTDQNPSYAFAAGGVISTADDLATWIRALVRGKVLDAAYQRQWLDSPVPQDPNAPEGQRYGYGISLITFGPNRVYFHGGEMPGYNSFMGYDPVNEVTLIIWTSLTVSLDGKPTANTIMLKMLDRIYTVSPLH